MFDSTQLIKDLQEMRDHGHLSDALLRHAVKEVAASDDRFDWVGVYLLNEEDNEVWLHNYVGEPTELAKIAVGEGVLGNAVETKENRNVPNVDEADDYISWNPDVKSEMVVLIRAGDEIFGEIEIESEQVEAFGEEEMDALQGVADKLAEQIAAERR